MIDEPGARRKPRIRWSTLEWKLVLTTIVSTVYATAWIVFAARVPRTETATPMASSAVVQRGSSATVWLSDVPAAKRPTISLPPGWIIAEQSTRPRPVVVHRPARDFRIRTRTS